jgi:membrane protein DedA with SNARE-associated domain
MMGTAAFLSPTGGAYIGTIGRAGGRPLVERYGRYILGSPGDLDRAERWYQRHERFGLSVTPVTRSAHWQ